MAIAEELHFGRAAERLHMSQPPLSYQIRLFEKRVGVPLIERTTRSVRLTPAGLALRDAGRRLMSDGEYAVNLARKIGQGESGTIRIGFTSTSSYRLVPSVISVYRARYPDILLVVKEADSAQLQNDLCNDRLDVALIRHDNNENNSQLFFRVIDREPLVAALPRMHPLTKRAIVTLEQLAQTELIGFEQTSSPYFHKLLDEFFLSNQLSPNYVMRSLLPTILTLVASGIGATIVPSSVTDLRAKDVQYRSINAKSIFQSTLYVAYHRESLNAAVHAFIDILDEQIIGR